MNLVDGHRSDIDSWTDDEGMHVVGRGSQPPPEELQRMTEEYQKRIKESPVWGQMVKEFGEEQATEMLKEFRVKVN